MVQFETRANRVCFPGTAREAIHLLNIATADFDGWLAATAIELRLATRLRGLSLGDRACLALALRENAEVLTADKAWEGLAVNIEIRQVR